MPSDTIASNHLRLGRASDGPVDELCRVIHVNPSTEVPLAERTGDREAPFSTLAAAVAATTVVPDELDATLRRVIFAAPGDYTGDVAFGLPADGSIVIQLVPSVTGTCNLHKFAPPIATTQMLTLPELGRARVSTASLRDAHIFWIVNKGAGDLVVASAVEETIEGAASKTIAGVGAILVVGDGTSDWLVVVGG